jgi:excisionase family DNA binding protein
MDNILTYSIREAARAASMSRSMLYQEIAHGRLIARKLGRRTVILQNDLKAFLGALPRSKPKKERL